MVQSAALGSSGFFPTLTFTVNDSFLHTKHSPHNATASRHIHLGLTQDYYHWTKLSLWWENFRTLFKKPDDNKSISISCQNHNVSKLPKMSHFWILAFLTIFGILKQLLSTQNVNIARFARNVECDFLGDFQTLWMIWEKYRLRRP